MKTRSARAKLDSSQRRRTTAVRRSVQAVTVARERDIRGMEYRDLWNFAPVIWIVIDRDGIILDINSAGCMALGQRAGFVVGTPLRTWADGPSRMIILEHLRRCRSTTDLVESSIKLLHRGGWTMSVRLCSRRSEFRGQTVFPSVAIDVTEQESSERARIAAERQRDLADQERQVARAAEAAKDRLIASVSHELRNPLSPALMAASNLANHPDLPDRLRRMVGIIKKNIQLEARLIDDLLDVARASRGQLSLRVRNVDVHDVMREAIASCTAAAEAKQIAITTNLDAAERIARADFGRLQQVFWNLLNNALKFSPPGSQVLVRTATRDGNLTLTVRDFGRGMDAQTLGRLFSPFEQPQAPEGGNFAGAGAGAGVGVGLGLGLTIARNIVDLHGGQVWASSEGPGCGSTFEVDLPVIIGGVVEVDPAAAPPGAAPVQIPLHRGRTLVVEDHEDSGSVLQILLTQRGYDVTVARSLAEGLEALRQPWDIVLSDLGLGDGNGLDIGRAASTAAIRPRHLIAVSGYGTPNDIRASRAAGFDHHVIKPIDPQRLLDLLESDGVAKESRPLESVGAR